MKASIRKRLQQLEDAATAQGARQIVLVEVLAMTEEDREAYWAGDDAVLRRYGAPDPSGCPEGSVHTIVIEVHPACRPAWSGASSVDGEDDA